MDKIAIRADGSSTIGMGHIIRCITLANEFKTRNIEVLFITKKNEIVNKLLYENNIKTVNIVTKNLYKEVKEVKEILVNNQIKSIIVDSYYLNEDYLLQLHNSCKLLISIDDNNLYKYPSDIIINGNIYATEMIYYKKDISVKLLLGSKYIILREEFRKSYPIKIKDKVENVLITMGGSDINSFTPIVINSIKDIDVNINVIIGNGFKCTEEIQKACKDSSNTNLIYNPTNMADVMKENDIAISASGTTAYELGVLGIPTILIPQAENQIKLSQKVHELNMMLNMGDHRKIKDNEIKNTLLNLIKNKSMRERMNKLSTNFVDKNGVNRIVDEILEI